jgi:hypothetical protein
MVKSASVAELLMLPIARASNNCNTFKNGFADFSVFDNASLAKTTLSTIKKNTK